MLYSYKYPTFRFLINIHWFREFIKKYSVSCELENANSINNNGDPKQISNSCLLSDKFDLFQTLIQAPQNKQSFETINCTDKLLREDIEMDKDYTVVNKKTFDYIKDTLGYECSDVICR